MPASTLVRRLLPHWPAMLLAGAAVLVALLPATIQQLLRYERAAILAGEWWRLLTGHLVHLGPVHLALNLGGVVVVYGLFRSALTTTGWALALLLSALAATLGLLLWSPEVGWYVGLSGQLHGAFLAAALAAWKQQRPLAITAMALLVLKLLGELWFGPSTETSRLIGGHIIGAAHLYGALGGLVTTFATHLRRHRD